MTVTDHGGSGESIFSEQFHKKDQGLRKGTG